MIRIENVSKSFRKNGTAIDAVRGMNNVSVRGSEGGMYVMLDISDVEPDDEKFDWALLDQE